MRLFVSQNFLNVLHAALNSTENKMAQCLVSTLEINSVDGSTLWAWTYILHSSYSLCNVIKHTSQIKHG